MASRAFFQGDLARFNIEMDTPVKVRSKARGPRRLNVVAALDAIGEGNATPNGQQI